MTFIRIQPGRSESPQWVCGLDLGQAADPSALCVIERAGEELHVRHLQRFPLRTPYPQIREAVKALMRQLPPPAVLIIDQTGVGRAVYDIFVEAGLRPLGVTITGGDKVTWDGDRVRVPKRDLAGALSVSLDNHRLRIAADLTEARTLENELLNFRAKITTAGNDTYEGRSGIHDDIVLATAIAAWYAIRPRPARVRATQRVYEGIPQPRLFPDRDQYGMKNFLDQEHRRTAP